MYGFPDQATIEFWVLTCSFQAYTNSLFQIVIILLGYFFFNNFYK